MPDAKILYTLAETLNIEQTKQRHNLTDADLRDVLIRASGEKEIPLGAYPIGPGMLIIYVDGASRGNPGPAGAGMIAIRDGRVVESQCSYLGETTNNQAEYKALILALERAHELGATEIEIRSDSELMVKQLNGEYQVKNAGIKPLYDRVQRLTGRFPSFRIRHINRDDNQQADAMANRAIDEFS